MESASKLINFKSRKLSKSLSKQKYQPYLKKSTENSMHKYTQENFVNCLTIQLFYVLEFLHRKSRLMQQEANLSKNKLKIDSKNITQKPQNQKYENENKQNCRNLPEANLTQSCALGKSNLSFKQVEVYNAFLQKIDLQNKLIKEGFNEFNQKISFLQQNQEQFRLSNQNIIQSSQLEDEDEEKTIKNGQQYFNLPQHAIFASFSKGNPKTRSIDQLRLHYLKTISMKNEEIDYLNDIISHQEKQIGKLKQPLIKPISNKFTVPSIAQKWNSKEACGNGSYEQVQMLLCQGTTFRDEGKKIEKMGENQITDNSMRDFREPKVEMKNVMTQTEEDQKNEEKQKEIIQMQEERQSWRKEITQLNSKNGSLQTSLTTLLNHLNKTESSLSSVSNELIHYQHQCAQLQATNEYNLEIIKDLKYLNQQLVTQIRVLRQKSAVTKKYYVPDPKQEKVTSLDNLGEDKSQKKQSKKSIKKSRNNIHDSRFIHQKKTNFKQTPYSVKKINSSILSNKILYFKKGQKSMRKNSGVHSTFKEMNLRIMLTDPNEDFLQTPSEKTHSNSMSKSIQKLLQTPKNTQKSMQSIGHKSKSNTNKSKSGQNLSKTIQYGQHVEMDRLKIAKSYLRIRRRSSIKSHQTEFSRAKTGMIIAQKKDNSLLLIRRSIGIKMKAFQQRYQQLQLQWMQKYPFNLPKQDLTKLLMQYPFFLVKQYADTLQQYIAQDQPYYTSTFRIDQVLCKLREFIPEYELATEQRQLALQQKLKRSIFLQLPQVLQEMKRYEHEPGIIRQKQFIRTLKQGGFGDWEVQLLLGQCCIISKDVENLAFQQYLNIFLLEQE